MARDVTYGIIGAGLMGNEHIRNLELLPRARVIAVADPHEPSLARAKTTLGEASAGVTFAADYRRLLDDARPDVWVIASPNHTHKGILLDCLASPGAIMVEKPLATTIEDCRQIAAAARGHEAPIWVALEYRHMPPVAEFLRRLSGGAGGELKMISIREHRFPFLKKVGDWNRFNINTGGTLVEKCCHFFDLMRLMAGSEPTRIYASGAQDVNHKDERYDGRQPDIIDNAFVIVDFASGLRAQLDLSMFAEGSAEQEEIVAVGDRAKLEVFIPSGMIVTSPRRPKGPIREHVSVPEEILRAGSHHGASYYHHLAFLAALEGMGPVVTGLDDGLKSVAMGLAAQRSIAEGRAVAMAEFGL